LRSEVASDRISTAVAGVSFFSTIVSICGPGRAGQDLFWTS